MGARIFFDQLIETTTETHNDKSAKQHLPRRFSDHKTCERNSNHSKDRRDRLPGVSHIRTSLERNIQFLAVDIQYNTAKYTVNNTTARKAVESQ
jgi:hypothetical protein